MENDEKNGGGAAERLNSLVLLKLVHDHYEIHEQRILPHPDAPGHSHSVRGRWDRDGSVCEWCQIWDKVRECVKQNDPHHLEQNKGEPTDEN